MNEKSDDRTKSGEQRQSPDSESTNGAALDEIRKAYRMWRTGETGKLALCNAVDRILKTVGK
jgi:hypothetical protein